MLRLLHEEVPADTSREIGLTGRPETLEEKTCPLLGSRVQTGLAAGIDAHLRRFEADPEINKRDAKYGTVPYHHAYARRGGRFVYVQYVGYHSTSYLTKVEAIAYLKWLDAGNVGKHWSQQRQEGQA